MEKFSKVWWIRLLIACTAIAVFFITGFVQTEPCNGIDITTLYCALHPMKELDVVGMCLFVSGCFLFSGVWSLFINEDEITSGKSWFIHLLLLGVAGIGLLLIYTQW